MCSTAELKVSCKPLTSPHGSIRREDLESVSASSSQQPSSPELSLKTQYLEKLGATYDCPRDTIPQHAEVPLTGHLGPKVRDEDTDAYDFRLFSNPSKASEHAPSSSHVQRVALRSPTPPNRAPAFIRPRRPDTFYFTGPASSEQANRYRQSAVSGQDLAAGLKQRWVCESQQDALP